MLTLPLCVAAFAGTLTGACADDPASRTLRLATVFADNMVLQANAKCPIWGWEVPHAKVTIHPDFSKEVVVEADADGKWTAMIDTPAADSPPYKGHTVEIRGGRTITLNNVLLGEVWICSGQSNMEMPVGNMGGGYRGTKDYEKELAAADHPAIRLMDVRNTASAAPANSFVWEGLGAEGGVWHLCNPRTVNSFSAVGYFFARNLQDKLHVPIGLIGSNWGGTPAQSWTSADGLKDFPQYAQAIAKLANQESPQEQQKKNIALINEWSTKLEAAVVADFATLQSTPPTKEVTIPTVFGEDLANFDGIIWCQREIEVPETWGTKSLTLTTGGIDDMNVIFIDGKPVARTLEVGNWDHPRKYTIDSLSTGKHVITLAVIDTGGPAATTGEKDQWALVAEGISGKRLSGTWKVRAGAPISKLPRYPQIDEVTAWTPTALYNGMIAPLVPMRIAGAIWYQGESNRGEPDNYAKLFPAMINDWRQHFGAGWEKGAQPLGFYYVEIAPYNYGDGKPLTIDLRKAQRAALALPRTGVASTMDVGNLGDIHPNDKQAVGDRLARSALHGMYHMDSVVDSGPVAASARADGSGVRITFTHADGGLNGDGNGFEVAGSDKVFSKAVAKIEGSEILLTSDSVKAPGFVRFAGEELSQVSMWNGEHLPMQPFEIEISAAKK